MATIRHRRGVSVLAQIRLSGYPTKSKSFKYVDHGGKRGAEKAAKDWGQAAEVAMKKLDPATMRRGAEKTFIDVVDVHLQTRAGFRLGDETPREALKRFKRDGSNACALLGDKRPMSGNALATAITVMNFWIKWFDGKPLAKIKPADVVAGLDFLNDGTRRPATVNRYHSYVRAAFNLVVTGRRNRSEWIETNPAPSGKLRENNLREVILDNNQKKRLLKACQKSDNPDLYLIVLIGIATGMRQGNIMGLRWDGIDMKTGRVFFEADQMKSGKSFATFITGGALEELKARKASLRSEKVRSLHGSEWVFPSSRIDDHMDFPKKSWATALKKAGIKAKVDKRSPNTTGFRFHDLRHTFATQMAAEGASDQQLMLLMGHSSTQMVTRYANLDIDHVRHLFDRVSD